MSSLLEATSTSSEVFCALRVTNLFTTGLSFKSNIFTHVPLDDLLIKFQKSL